jgi:uncharacterized membrane protein HdeD (DUF308 family)
LTVADSPLLRTLADNWWLFLLRGLSGIAFAIIVFARPEFTVLTMIFMWGAYALSDGIFALWAGVSGGGGVLAPRWWLVTVGVASILAGLLTFFWQGMTPLLLSMFIAGWALAVGVLQVCGAIQLRKEMEGEWMLAVTGVLGIAFGLFMITLPDAHAKEVVWSIAWFAVLAGITYCALAFRLKKYREP